MAKSWKKQCRKPKQRTNGGGLVVVSARDVQAKSADAPDRAKGTANKKGKRKREHHDGVPGVPTTRNVGPDGDFNVPRLPPSSTSSEDYRVPHLSFASTHSREQRLYYLLVTRSQLQAKGAGGSKAGGTREGGCHAVVFVEATTGAQCLLGELKALGLTAFAVHERTPKAQRQDYIKRFRSSASAEKSSVLILTNAAVVRSLPIGPLPLTQAKLVRVVHFDASEGNRNAAARRRITAGVFGERGQGAAEEVHLEEPRDAMRLTSFTFESEAMSGISSRLAVAKKLARLVISSAAVSGEERGMQRAAASAGLEWEESGGQRHERSHANSQQVAALRGKLSVLLCQQLLPTADPMARCDSPSSTSNSKQISQKELRKKMSVLGMICSSPGMKGWAEDRAVAQTRWLDGADGKTFGGRWDGAVRMGASCDDASLDLRAQVEAAKMGQAGGDGEHRGGAKDATALENWKPNPNTPDEDRWGGRWGKPCGHNEVVLHHLRHFAPMEVVNTRVCSKASPAPGNSGYDGCLELLSLSCRAHAHALTVWDDASFLHIDEAGVCTTLPKQAILYLPLPTLRFLVKNMRSFTVCGEGRTPPREVARTVIRATGWGAKQSQFGPLSTKLSSRVLSFVLSGDEVAWKSAAASFRIRVEKWSSTTDGSKPCETLSPAKNPEIIKTFEISTGAESISIE